MKIRRGICKAALLTLVGIALLYPLHPLQAQIRRTQVGNISGANLNGQTGNRPRNGSNNPNNPFGTDTAHADTSATKGLVFVEEVPDSILRHKVFLFFYQPRKVKLYEVWNPTLDPTGAQFCEPLDALNGNYYLGKGLTGHPHYAVYPSLTGIDMQFQPDEHAGYAKSAGNVRLYQTFTPYSILGYSSSLNKDYLVHLAHTQNVAPGWNLAFDYRLIRPTGIYSGSSAKNHYLDVTTNYYSPDSRVQASGGIIWQKFNVDENGGLADDTYFTEQLQSNRAGIPVQLYNMGSVHKRLGAFGHASYNLVQQVDAYRERDSIVVTVVNDSVTKTDTLQVVDTIPVGTPHVLNWGVIGVDIDAGRNKRLFTDSTLWRESSASVYWTNDAYPDHRWRNPLKITLGIAARKRTAVIEGDTLTLSSLLDPFACAEVAVGRGTITFDGDARGTMGFDPIPDYRFSGAFEWPFDTARNTLLRLSAATQRRMPHVRMIYDAYVDDGIELAAINSQHYGLRFTHKEMLDINLSASHLDHNVWYDSTLAVIEGTQPLWLVQASVTARLHAGWMHLDMQQLAQYSTDPIQMPVPLIASKNSLYADINLFRNALRAQIGVDLRYHTPFLCPSYDPATGLFVHQDRQLVGGYLWGDVFINLQIKRASIFAKAGHVNALWESSPTYFLLPHYPGQKFGLFWGINWNFFD